MAPHNEEDDPAVYRSGEFKKPSNSHPPPHGEASSSKPAPMDVETSVHKFTPPLGKGAEMDDTNEADGDIDIGEEEEEEESTLLTVQPGFNRLLLVLRDERVMRFVKYISAAAEGSRWDVCGEYEVGMVQEEDFHVESVESQKSRSAAV